jgi:hypothetical protein
MFPYIYIWPALSIYNFYTGSMTLGGNQKLALINSCSNDNILYWGAIIIKFLFKINEYLESLAVERST